jgi:hypothetical protein
LNSSKTGSGSSARHTSAFLAELQQLEAMRETALQGLLDTNPQLDLMVYQADWHLRGLTYHLERIYKLYGHVSKEVGGRALAGADVIVMYAPYMKDLTFEFYAFINLARITLDQLQRYAAPAFSPRSTAMTG